MPAVGAYSLLATVTSIWVGLWKQPSMSSSTYSFEARLVSWPAALCFF